MRKWLNSRNIIGGILLLAILVVGLFPGQFSPLSPYQQDVFHHASYQAPPFPVSSQHWFGTDQDGYDLFARIVYGILPTLRDATLLVLCVLVVSFAVALLRRVYHVRIPVFDFVSDIMGVVPPVLLALLFLEAPWYYFSPQLAVWYCVIVVALEVARFVPTVEGDLKLLYDKPFVEASLMAGASRFRIFYKHLIPWMRPYLMEYLPLVYARILTVMGELAYFAVYKNVKVVQSQDGVLITTKQLDWPSLIGMYSQHWFTVPASVLFPTVAFCVLILTLRLLSAGIAQSMAIDRTQHWAWKEQRGFARAFSNRKPRVEKPLPRPLHSEV